MPWYEFTLDFELLGCQGKWGSQWRFNIVFLIKWSSREILCLGIWFVLLFPKPWVGFVCWATGQCSYCLSSVFTNLVLYIQTIFLHYLWAIVPFFYSPYASILMWLITWVFSQVQKYVLFGYSVLAQKVIWTKY